MSKVSSTHSASWYGILNISGRGKLQLISFDSKIPIKVLFASIVRTLNDHANFYALHDLKIHSKIEDKYLKNKVKYIRKWNEIELGSLVLENNCSSLIFCEATSILLDLSIDSLLSSIERLPCNCILLVNKDSISKKCFERLNYNSSQACELKATSFGSFTNIDLRSSKTNKPSSDFFKLNIDTKSFQIGIQKISNEQSKSYFGGTMSTSAKGDDMEKLTSFNLKLTENEEMHRAANVKLPYVKKHQKVQVGVGDDGSIAVSTEKGQIFYEPDKEDDFDYEDPDDDLDI